MKWLYYLAFIFFSLISTLKTVAQDEFDYNLETMNWIFVRDSKLTVPPYYSRDTLHFYFDGDTLINEKLYYKSKLKGVFYPENENFAHQYEANKHLYRIDTIAKMVYLYDETLNQEKLVMNYDLELNSDFNSETMPVSQVTDIDTIIYCDIEFKKYLIEGSFWVKDVISLPNLDIFEFESETGFCKLNCFYINNNINCEQCVLPSSIVEQSVSNILISPNPATNFLLIEGINADDVESLYIEIFDFNGRRCSINYEHTFYGIKLYLKDNQNGIYLLNLQNNVRIISTFKFVINN